MKFLKQADYIEYVIAKLLKYVEISMWTSSEDSLKIQKDLELASTPNFLYKFTIKFFFR